MFLARLNASKQSADNLPLVGSMYYHPKHNGNMRAVQVQALLIHGGIQLVRMMQTGTMVRTRVDQWKLVCSHRMPGAFMI